MTITLDTEAAWIQTATGKRFYPLAPEPTQLDIFDIAHALAHTCRYTGHTRRFYSVAEHCYWISMAASQQNKLWGLMHDAEEFAFPDLAKPVKPFFPEFREAGQNLLKCITGWVGLPWPEPPEIKELDTRILHNERVALLGEPAAPWNVPGEPLPNVSIAGWHPEKARTMFLVRFRQLTGQQVEFIPPWQQQEQ